MLQNSGIPRTSSHCNIDRHLHAHMPVWILVQRTPCSSCREPHDTPELSNHARIPVRELVNGRWRPSHLPAIIHSFILHSPTAQSSRQHLRVLHIVFPQIPLATAQRRCSRHPDCQFPCSADLGRGWRQASLIHPSRVLPSSAQRRDIRAPRDTAGPLSDRHHEQQCRRQCRRHE